MRWDLMSEGRSTNFISYIEILAYEIAGYLRSTCLFIPATLRASQ